MKELLCRVNALIRRTYGANRQEEQMTFGNVQVNFTSRTVIKDGKNVALSLREFDLLAYLCRHKNTAVKKGYAAFGSLGRIFNGRAVYADGAYALAS
mgnify:CR=1 FL=1